MKPHPWGDFLAARMRAVVWMRDEMHYSPEATADALSMDPGQVRLILASAERTPSAVLPSEPTGCGQCDTSVDCTLAGHCLKGSFVSPTKRDNIR